MNYSQHFKRVLIHSDFGADKPSIQAVQHALNLAGASPPLVEDGKFGPLSTAALRAFQQVHNLKVDGILGPQSYTALGLMGSPAPTSIPAGMGIPAMQVPSAVPSPVAVPAAPLPPAPIVSSDPLATWSTQQKLAALLGGVALFGVGVAIATHSAGKRHR